MSQTVSPSTSRCYGMARVARAVMRHMIVLANALLREGRDWLPERPRPRRILVRRYRP